MTTPITHEPGVLELDRTESRRFLERRVRDVLGMGLDDFLSAVDAGSLDLGRPQVMHLVMLLPFAR